MKKGSGARFHYWLAYVAIWLLLVAWCSVIVYVLVRALR